MNRNTIIVIAIILCGIFVLFMALSFFEKEEDKIKRIIYAAKEATEKEDIIRCMSFISYAYADKDGNNKAMLFGIAQQVFKSYDNLLIDIKIAEVSLFDKTKAKAHLICFGQGRRSPHGGAGSPLVLDTQKVEFEIVFQKEYGRWKVIELRFIDPKDFLNLLKGL